MKKDLADFIIYNYLVLENYGHKESKQKTITENIFFNG
jgi:hypothetical protein